MDSVKRLAGETGAGCILVEQHVDVVLDFATSVIVLERGRIVFSGTPEAMRAAGDVLESAIGIKKVAV